MLFEPLQDTVLSRLIVRHPIKSSSYIMRLREVSAVCVRAQGRGEGVVRAQGRGEGVVHAQGRGEGVVRAHGRGGGGWTTLNQCDDQVASLQHTV